MTDGRWAVEVWQTRGLYGRTQHVATQIFDTETEAKAYARANREELPNSTTYCNVRPAFPDEKNFA